MKYGDFSSLVQLGVGLHLGTAALQQFGEFWVAPVGRTLARIRSAHEGTLPEREGAELSKLESDLELFRIQFSNEYKAYWIVNTACAVFLMVALVIISWRTDDPLQDWLAVIFTGLSLFPALITLVALWIDAARAVRPTKERAEELEARTFGPVNRK